MGVNHVARDSDVSSWNALLGRSNIACTREKSIRRAGRGSRIVSVIGVRGNMWVLIAIW